MYVTLSNQQLHLYCEPKAGAECTSWLLSLAFPPLSEVSPCYPKAVQNCKAVNRRSILMSLGSLVMQIWCNTCAVAPQGRSQGTLLWKEPEKGTASRLLRGQSCFFHHQDGSAQAFRPLNSLWSSTSNFQYHSYNAIFICEWLLSPLQQQDKDRHQHRQRYFVSRSTDRTGCPGPLASGPFPSLSCRNDSIQLLPQKLMKISTGLLFKKNNKKQYFWQRKIR